MEYVTPDWIHWVTGTSYVIYAYLSARAARFQPLPFPLPARSVVLMALFVLACGLHHLTRAHILPVPRLVGAGVDMYMAVVSVSAVLDRYWLNRLAGRYRAKGPA